MAENLKLTLVQNRTYEVGTFDGGTYNWSGVNTGSTNSYNTVLNGNTIANDSTTGEWYYTWYAATAGQGTNTANPTINRSICPKGWRLPGDSDSPNFSSLITTYGIGNRQPDAIKILPLDFVAVGDYSGGGGHNGANGHYWYSSPVNASKAYYLYFDVNQIILKHNNPKYIGYSVRCVAIP